MQAPGDRLTAMDATPDDELIQSISSDVMKCLDRAKFFEKLDDILCPKASAISHSSCDGTYKLSESILLSSGFERDDLADIFGVLHSKGACCDCEILFNVADVSRLKSEYWRCQASNREGRIRHTQ
jgi:hypothetical protein